MHKRFLVGMGCWLASAGLAFSQGVGTSPVPAVEQIAPPSERLPDAPVMHPSPHVGAHEEPVDHHEPLDVADQSYWVTGDFLLWWLKDAPLSVPIATRVTTNDALTAVARGQVPGAIQSAGTEVVSPRDLGFGATPGGRISFGSWLDCERIFGVEAGGFLTETNRRYFLADGTRNDGVNLYVPIFDASQQRESVVPVSVFDVSTGLITARASASMGSLEVSGLVNLLDDEYPNPALVVLAGPRYLDLNENLQILTQSSAVDNTSVTSYIDRFSTRNQFLGGQVGIRGEIHQSDLVWSFSSKIALGTMHESVNINGVTNVFSPLTGASQNFTGGIFAQPTNAGRQTHSTFVVMPELSAHLGYDITYTIRAYGGYDFLYISEVARPGLQLDHAVNPTQMIGGKLVGQPAPPPEFNRADFWAHGLSFGMIVKF